MEPIRLENGKYYHIYNRGNNRMNLFEKPSDYEHFLWLYNRYISPISDTLAWVLMPNHLHLLIKIKENVVYKYSKDRPVKINVNAVAWDKFFEENKWETIDLSASTGPDNIEIEGKMTSTGPARLRHSGGPDNIESGGTSINLNADRSLTLSGLSSNKKPEAYRHFSHLFNAYTRYLHTRTGRTGNLFQRPFKRILIADDEYLRNCILYIHNNPVHHGFCEHPLEYPWSSYLTCVSDKPTKLKRETITGMFGGTNELIKLHNQNFDSESIEKWLGIDDSSSSDRPARLAGGPENIGDDEITSTELDYIGDVK